MAGAIWGVIYLGTKSSKRQLYDFETYEKTYQADDFESYESDTCLMRAACVHIGEQEQDGKMIYHNHQEKITVIADIILDNRSSLITALATDYPKELQEASNSRLIYEAYLKWGRHCSEHLLGDFAFVIYDEKNSEIYVSRDHMGNRVVYYHYNKGVLRFGTLLKSTINPLYRQPELNHLWVQDFLAMPVTINQILLNDTAYARVKFVEPANYLFINRRRLVKKKYWDPFRYRHNYKSEEEAHLHFYKNFQEAVACRIKSGYPISIMLSGGLDSTAVAAMAASLLKEAQKEIHGLTSVPCCEVTPKKSYEVTDERDNVLAMSKLYPNLRCNLLDFKEHSAASVAESLVNAIEVPYRFVVNSSWIYPMYEEAKIRGSRIILDGHHGNSSISRGEVYDSMLLFLMQGNLKRFYRLYNIYITNGYSHRRMIKHIVKSLTPSPIHYVIRLLRYKHLEDFSSRPVLEKVLKKNKFAHRLNRVGCGSLNENGFGRDIDKLGLRSFMRSHGNEINVKLGLTQGVIVRDPTADKRVVELTLNMPVKYLCDEQNNRKLVRVALSNIMPASIVTKQLERGVQGADWCIKLEPEKKKVIHEVMQLLEYTELSYLNKAFISEVINNVSNDMGSEEDYTQLLILYNFSLYYRSL